jgi:hypothetical protein
LFFCFFKYLHLFIHVNTKFISRHAENGITKFGSLETTWRGDEMMGTTVRATLVNCFLHIRLNGPTIYRHWIKEFK